jgi:ppGpp synthetase/RelA/SpoT-type nucleotidyltranferase
LQKDFDKQYAQAVDLLPAFGQSLESLLEHLLTAKGIRFHRVNHRVKSKDSAERKMTRPRKGATDAGPRTLESLTDLLGVRIVTYFRNEIEKVAEVMEHEFAIDWENSVDKQIALDADRFGYLSMHYIAGLKPDRTALPEYQDYGGIKFEVQIRSILQHAWAEMEHDLGYKSTAAVPRDFRRRFSRLAGILELVDDEFVGIRQAIDEYQVEAQETIDQGSLGIEIDQDSLSAFVQTSRQIAQLDKLIAGFRRTSVQKRADTQYLGRQAGQLVESGFHSIEDLSNYLDENSALLAKFTEHWLSHTDYAPRVGRASVPVGITLYYVGALKATQGERDGNTAARAFLANNPKLLRQALDAATMDLRSADGS